VNAVGLLDSVVSLGRELLAGAGICFSKPPANTSAGPREVPEF
jgi:hypothetical protein